MSFEECAGQLYFQEGPISISEAAQGFASGTDPKHVLVKTAPQPCLFIMSDEEYYEFSLMDIIAITDGATLAPQAKDTSWEKRILLLTFEIEGIESNVWLAGSDAGEKTLWINQIAMAVESVRNPNRPEAKQDDDNTSWEIPEKNIHIEKKVGAGHFGDVFLGQLWGKEVAIKKMQELSDEAFQSVKAEIAMLSKLRHPNIVLYIGACSNPPDVQIVTEWCHHGSLEDLLLNQDTQFNMQSLMRSALEIAQGMSYLHSRRVMHRDLKSANVFVDKNLVMKVGDFGLSHAMQNEIADIAGTPMFMAPECWGGEYDQTVDVWAYGMLLIELITRDQPFPAISSEEVQQLVVSKKLPKIPEWVPPPLREVIVHCWDYDPSKRWSFEVIIEKLNYFSTWDKQRFYQEVDFPRLRFFLSSHDERRLVWAVNEIAALEAALPPEGGADSAVGVSIYNSPKEEVVAFLARLTHLLGHSSPRVQLGACKALANFFTRLNGEIQQPPTEAAGKKPAPAKMTLDQCKFVVANENGGISLLIGLLVSARKDRHRDHRLLGLKPALTAGQMKRKGSAQLHDENLKRRELEREALRLLSQLLGPKLAIAGLDRQELTYLRKFAQFETSTLKRQLRSVQATISNNQALLADICLAEVKADLNQRPEAKRSESKTRPARPNSPRHGGGPSFDKPSPPAGPPPRNAGSLAPTPMPPSSPPPRQPTLTSLSPTNAASTQKAPVAPPAKPPRTDKKMTIG